jgi:hypothetical protein
MRHILLTCCNHPELRWFVKSIAVNRNGSYNGMRNIFFEGRATGLTRVCRGVTIEVMEFVPECPCPPSDLRFANDAERDTWRSEYPERVAKGELSL